MKGSLIMIFKRLYSYIIAIGTKETAFIHAITSAGVAFSVTQSCSRGMFPDCDKCDKSKKGHVDKSGEWKWGECNDNVNEGLKFAEEFIDSTEKYIDRIRRSRKRHLRRTMNLHNNRAGRLVCSSLLRLYLLKYFHLALFGLRFPGCLTAIAILIQHSIKGPIQRPSFKKLIL